MESELEEIWMFDVVYRKSGTENDCYSRVIAVSSDNFDDAWLDVVPLAIQNNHLILSIKSVGFMKINKTELFVK